MSLRTSLIAAFVLTGLAAAATAATATSLSPVQTRQVADRLAVLLKDQYVNPLIGERLADRVNGRALAHELDRPISPAVLAATLTQRLREAYPDKHLSVEYDAPLPAPVGSAASPEATLEKVSALRSFGIRRADLLGGNIGYVRLTEIPPFCEAAATLWSKALGFVSGADALILDLRGNPGGDSDMERYFASYFLGPGVKPLLTFYSRIGNKTETSRTFDDLIGHGLFKMPLYILIDQDTGSAAEALAFTLQQAGRATVVGTRSQGAANSGGLVSLGHGLKVFIPRNHPYYQTPDRTWEGTGVIPDHEVDSTTALRVAQALALDAQLKTKLSPIARLRKQWALEALGDIPPATPDCVSGSYGDRRILCGGGQALYQHSSNAPILLTPLASGRFALGETAQLAFKKNRLIIYYDDGHAITLPRTQEVSP